ncbi:urate oxidase [Pseudonocardia sp. KRD-184]|uniref:Uricase n=1 Tax=Pseudonocardia oceani TaxID=2792013 RepID=A0ABS6U1R1_9PSEU|nr:urate oxidase [Pseudonocardia oceani]MBW0090447.1 urate oxidase [Pseudonocardia oceani]MBW0098230.1 urate oxidase [Pseudonocardia oceani]MBW0110204.1 urate oxidase [Pseudonocardia oceani]MBW0124229.1 urate oxidase [Pseudonocardia oceani]MBW0126187.1 urate oxidase [Pseudonocardia oceani]
MGIVLGTNQYGKAENRLVRIHRETDRHEIRDVTVSTALRGDFTAAHRHGDQSDVLPTDTQKNTCYAFAKSHGLGEIEDYALALARHFVDDVAPVRGARIAVDEFAWERVPVGGTGHDHAFVRTGSEVRTTVVTVDDDGAQVVSGLRDLVLLKSTGSEFAGFLVDEYTTLAPTHDRIMSTSLVTTWTYTGTDVSWDKTWANVRRILLERFACVHSLALQQTLWEMGRAVLEEHPEIAEISLSAPNRHHFVVDLAPFGLENRNEVFYAADRPYGLIEATVGRD